MLTLDQLGITEEDWNQMPAAGRVAIMFLLKQNQLLENRNYTYFLEVEGLKTKLERLKTLELEVAELRERWPEGEKENWLWINATPEVTVFRILAGRGQAEAREVIGRGFLGIVSTDRYAAYH